MSDNKESNNVVSFLKIATEAIEKGDDEYEKVFGIDYDDDSDNNKDFELHKKFILELHKRNKLFSMYEEAKLSWWYGSENIPEKPSSMLKTHCIDETAKMIQKAGSNLKYDTSISEVRDFMDFYNRIKKHFKINNEIEFLSKMS
jgi:hypothetical protein